MTSYDVLALFLIMVGLAAIPSSSVALVVLRSATRGISNDVVASED
jgi:threonine/homoserine/homoserine lactone efflux protein